MMAVQRISAESTPCSPRYKHSSQSTSSIMAVQRASAPCTSRMPHRENVQHASTPCITRSPLLRSSSPRSFGMQTPSIPGASKWELQVNDGWIPFFPGVRYIDQPGTSQDLAYRNFWYRLEFDASGISGKQT